MSESHGIAGSTKPHSHWLFRAEMANQQEENDD